MKIQQVKNRLREIVVKDLEKAIDELSKVVLPNSNLYDDNIYQKGRLNKINNEFNKGIISRDNYDLNINKIRKSTIDIIGKIQIEDIEEQSRIINTTKIKRQNNLRNTIIIAGVLIFSIFGILYFKNSGNEVKQNKKEILLEEYEKKILKNTLSNTTWQGGKNWGKVYFDESGTGASYTNTNGKSGGEIQIIKSNGYFFVGDWNQADNKSGLFYLAIPLNQLESDQSEEFKLRAAWTIDKVNIPDEEFWQEWTQIEK